jgi:hypothetical protein
LIDECVGFAVHQMGVGGLGHKIQSPAVVFTAELSVFSLLYDTLLRLYGLQKDVIFSLIA